ncbi:uncharacterized protein LOC115096343 [Rhinatrema bivittatum]|uniref:uncharacterized protein LOC115096343 n=1 Tax=Rhinatrema bivittatum TaxID=194408 RepID=UPI0011281937|nr:uncharacterized protein LOC115096343 [Rhinatrema bivittatum]
MESNQFSLQKEGGRQIPLMSLEGLQPVVENPLERTYNRKKCRWKMKVSAHELKFLKSLDLKELVLEIFRTLGVPVELELDGELWGTAPSLEDALEAEQALRGLIFQKVFPIPIKTFGACEWHVVKHWLKSKIQEFRNSVHIDIFQNGDTGSFQVVLVGFKDCFAIVERDLANFLHSQEYTTEHFPIGSTELLQLQELQNTFNLSPFQVEIEAKFDLRAPAILFHGPKKGIEKSKGIVAELLLRSGQRPQRACGTPLHDSLFQWTGDSVVSLHWSNGECSMPNVDAVIYPLRHSRIAGTGGGPSSTLGEITGQGQTPSRGISVSSQTIISQTGKLQRVIHLATVPQGTEEQLDEIPQGWEHCLTEAMCLGLDYAEKQGLTSLAVLCLESASDVLAPSAYARSVTKALKLFSQVCPFPRLKQVVFISDQEAALSKFSSRFRRKWRSLDSSQTALCLGCHEGKDNVQIEVASGYVAQEEVEAVAVPLLLDRQRRWRTDAASFLGPGLGVLDCLWDVIPEVAELQAGQVVMVPTRPYTRLKFQRLYLVGVCVHSDGSECRKKALASAMRKCLDECEKSFTASLAIPIPGQGAWALSSSEALRVVLEEVTFLGRQRQHRALQKIRLLLHPQDPAPLVVHQEIAQSFENLGLCVMEDEVFLGYLAACTDAHRDFCGRLRPFGGRVSAGGAGRALHLASLASGTCSEESLRSWAGAVLAAYEMIRDNYAAQEAGDASLVELLLNQHRQLLARHKSIRVCKRKKLVGRRPEVMELLRTLQGLAFQQEPVTKHWQAGSWAISVMVLKYLGQEGLFPGVEASQAPNASILLAGPRETVAAVEEHCNDLVSAIRWEEAPLTERQASFLRSMNEDVFVQNIFFAHDIMAGLQAGEQIRLFGMTAEAIDHAKAWLKEVICERSIAIPHSVRTLQLLLLDFVDMQQRELNRPWKLIEIHVLPNLTCPTQLILVGFYGTVLTTEKEILGYMNKLEEQVASLEAARLQEAAAAEPKSGRGPDSSNHSDQSSLTESARDTLSIMNHCNSGEQEVTGKLRTMQEDFRPAFPGDIQNLQGKKNSEEQHYPSIITNGKEKPVLPGQNIKTHTEQETSSITKSEAVRELVQETRDEPGKEKPAALQQKTSADPGQQLSTAPKQDTPSTTGQETCATQEQEVPTDRGMNEAAGPVKETPAELDMAVALGKEIMTTVKLDKAAGSSNEITNAPGKEMPITQGSDISATTGQRTPSAPGSHLAAASPQELITAIGLVIEGVQKEMPKGQIPSVPGQEMTKAQELVTVRDQKEISTSQGTDILADSEKETPSVPEPDMPEGSEQEKTAKELVIEGNHKEIPKSQGPDISAFLDQETPSASTLDIETSELEMPMTKNLNIPAGKEMTMAQGLNVPTATEQDKPEAPGVDIIATSEQGILSVPVQEMKTAQELVTAGDQKEMSTSQGTEISSDSETPSVPEFDMPEGSDQERTTAKELVLEENLRKRIHTSPGTDVPSDSEKEIPSAPGSDIPGASKQEITTAKELVTARDQNEISTSQGIDISADSEKETPNVPEFDMLEGSGQERTTTEELVTAGDQNKMSTSQGPDISGDSEKEIPSTPGFDMPEGSDQERTTAIELIIEEVHKEIPKSQGSDIPAFLDQETPSASTLDIETSEMEMPMAKILNIPAPTGQEKSMPQVLNVPTATEQDKPAAPGVDIAATSGQGILSVPEQEMKTAQELVTAGDQKEKSTSQGTDISADSEKEMPCVPEFVMPEGSDQERSTAKELVLAEDLRKGILTSPGTDVPSDSGKETPSAPGSDIPGASKQEITTAKELVTARDQKEISTSQGTDISADSEKEMPCVPEFDMPEGTAKELVLAEDLQKGIHTSPGTHVPSDSGKETPSAPGSDIPGASKQVITTDKELVSVRDQNEMSTSKGTDISGDSEKEIPSTPGFDMPEGSDQEITAAKELVIEEVHKEIPKSQGSDISAFLDQETHSASKLHIETSELDMPMTKNLNIPAGTEMTMAQGLNVPTATGQDKPAAPGVDITTASGQAISSVPGQEIKTAQELVTAGDQKEKSTSQWTEISSDSEKETPSVPEFDMLEGSDQERTTAEELVTAGDQNEMSTSQGTDISADSEKETPSVPEFDMLEGSEQERTTAKELVLEENLRKGIHTSPGTDVPSDSEKETPSAPGSDIPRASKQEITTAKELFTARDQNEISTSQGIDISADSEKETPNVPEFDMLEGSDQERTTTEELVTVGDQNKMSTSQGTDISADSEKETPSVPEFDMPEGSDQERTTAKELVTEEVHKEIPKSQGSDISAFLDQETPSASTLDIETSDLEMPMAKSLNISAHTGQEMSVPQVLNVPTATEQDRPAAPGVDIAATSGQGIPSVPEQEMKTAQELVTAGDKKEISMSQGTDISADAEKETPYVPEFDMSEGSDQERTTAKELVLAEDLQKGIHTSPGMDVPSDSGKETPSATGSDIPGASKQEIKTDKELITVRDQNEMSTSQGPDISGDSEKEIPSTPGFDMPEGSDQERTTAKELVIEEVHKEIPKSQGSDISAFLDQETPSASTLDIETSELEMPMAKSLNIPAPTGQEKSMHQVLNEPTATEQDKPEAPGVDIIATSGQGIPSVPGQEMKTVEKLVTAGDQKEMSTSQGTDISADSEKETTSVPEFDMQEGSDQERTAAKELVLAEDVRKGIHTSPGTHVPSDSGKETPSPPVSDIPGASKQEITTAKELVTVRDQKEISTSQGPDISADAEKETPNVPEFDMPEGSEQEKTAKELVIEGVQKEKPKSQGSDIPADPAKETPSAPALDIEISELAMSLDKSLNIPAPAGKEMSKAQGLNVPTATGQDMPGAIGVDITPTSGQGIPSVPGQEMKTVEKLVTAGDQKEMSTSQGTDISADSERDT